MAQVLKSGGRLLVMEFSQANLPGFQQIYDAYSYAIIPAMGEFVANDRESYKYLVESIRKFPPQVCSQSNPAMPTCNQFVDMTKLLICTAECSQEQFLEMLGEAGFRCTNFENLAGGIVAIHSGYKT